MCGHLNSNFMSHLAVMHMCTSGHCDIKFSTRENSKILIFSLLSSYSLIKTENTDIRLKLLKCCHYSVVSSAAIYNFLH